MSTSTAQSIFGRWFLASVDDKPAADVLRIGAAAEGIETALVDDSRIPVRISDIRPGGKYYSIVKLQIKFEKQLSSDTRWAHGTGWLIANDLVITAGHCTYDHTYNFRKAVKIRAYIGYNGKQSIGQPDVQFRQGRKIVTPMEWTTSDINRANDVSLILLDTPFNSVTPINYNPTAAAFKDCKLGVVGYPDDRTLDDEPGPQMYEMFKETTCDLSKTSLNMLEHTISFGPGQSGSPVLIDGQNTSIGTNVYGLGTRNSASVIRGEYGNYYKSMVDALSSTEAPVTTRNGVEYIKITQPEDAITNEPAGDEEAFWGCLNNVVNISARINSTVLHVGTPFLGPIVAPVTAVVGTALSVIGKLTSRNTEVAFDDKLGPPCAHHG
ncbi:glutamyl endopeptidase [Fusarium subglutinans]|uniref:Glutamyl endopeptidase n=1 Tax=Gibberella subglutinans TaxID=42677 RepID=A0A8H5KLK2_GIBSU|nr:glutamyl endopeptidase [Fusarium subglutinans]KAF5575447.1 glutamyl endopeptidase [Fusarium subglutinans]